MISTAASHRILAAVASTLLATVAIVGPSTSSGAQQPTPPDPYVQELPADGPSMVGASTGIPIFFGQAGDVAPGTAGTPIQIEDEDDFTALVPSPGSALAAGVDQFYEQGGGTAYVVATAGDDAASLALAIGSAQARVPGAELAVVPALGSLAGTDYLTVARATAQLAVASTGTALLDPPTSMVAEAAQDPATVVTELIGLATQLRTTVADPSRVVLYSSGLQDQGSGTPVSAAAAMAGVIDATDLSDGVWVAPAGLSQQLRGVVPTFAPTNPQIGQLNPNGVNSFLTLSGYGTVAWGARTLATQAPQMYVSAQRTLSYIQRTVTAGLQPFVFAANNPTTWSQVTADVSGFLTTLWSSGGLIGAAASQAFDVEVGVPTSMTGQDVLDGLLVVDIQVALTEPDGMTPLTLTQRMGS